VKVESTIEVMGSEEIPALLKRYQLSQNLSGAEKRFLPYSQ
jgi:hypothetical protein